MRVGLMAENPLESMLMPTGLVPVPMLETYAPVYARAIVTATKLGMFEALSDGGRSAEAVGKACGTHPGGTEMLLILLFSMR